MTKLTWQRMRGLISCSIVFGIAIILLFVVGSTTASAKVTETPTIISARGILPKEEVRLVSEMKLKVIEKTYNEEDLWWLSHVIFSENGNQSYSALVATGNVIMNRVSDERFPSTIKDVVLHEYKGDYQFDVVSNKTIYLEPSDDAIRSAKEVLDGVRVLPVNVLYFGANYAFDETIGARWWNGVYTYSVDGDVVFGVQP